MDSITASFGQLLTEGMRQKGLDYRTLAKLVGVSHGYLWQLVNADKRAINDPNAKRKRPTSDLTRKLAGALDLDVQTLLHSAGYTDQTPEAALTGPTRYATYAPTARQLYQDGLEASSKGQSDRAVALLEAALERGGVSFVNAHSGLGMAHYQARRYQAAITEFDAALAALETDPTGASIGPADLYYNRGMAYHGLARSTEGQAQFQARVKAAADFRQAIEHEGESQDLYHSALCYLLLEWGRPWRVLPYGRAFLARQATGPTRHTTAALDINLFLAYAQSARGAVADGQAMADMTLQLCPNYWFAHYVKAALLAQASRGHERHRRACLAAGLDHVRKAVGYHPQSKAHFRAELTGDFAAWADDQAFRQVIAEEEQA